MTYKLLFRSMKCTWFNIQRRAQHSTAHPASESSKSWVKELHFMKPEGASLLSQEGISKWFSKRIRSPEADRIQSHANVQWRAFYNKAMNNLFPQEVGNLFVSTHNYELATQTCLGSKDFVRHCVDGIVTNPVL